MRANCGECSKFFAKRMCRYWILDSGKIFLQISWSLERKGGKKWICNFFLLFFSLSFFFRRKRYFERRIFEKRNSRSWKKDGRCRCVWLVRILNILQWTWAVGFELFRKVSSQETLLKNPPPFFLFFHSYGIWYGTMSKKKVNFLAGDSVLFPYLLPRCLK